MRQQGIRTRVGWAFQPRRQLDTTVACNGEVFASSHGHQNTTFWWPQPPAMRLAAWLAMRLGTWLAIRLAKQR